MRGRGISDAGALGAGIGGVGSFAALYGLGSVVGLSAAGITSGLAAAGGIVGGGMVAGVFCTCCTSRRPWRSWCRSCLTSEKQTITPRKRETL